MIMYIVLDTYIYDRQILPNTNKLAQTNFLV